MHSHSAILIPVLSVLVLFFLCVGRTIATRPVRPPENAQVRQLATRPALALVSDANAFCGRCVRPGHEVGPLSNAGFCAPCTKRVAAFRQVEEIEDFTAFTIPAQLRPFTAMARRGA